MKNIIRTQKSNQIKARDQIVLNQNIELDHVKLKLKDSFKGNNMLDNPRIKPNNLKHKPRTSLTIKTDFAIIFNLTLTVYNILNSQAMHLLPYWTYIHQNKNITLKDD
jgi:hypothetical protein